ncbi:MAG: hypothetical protein JWL77_3928 [Chthonomonadaceae bacterium]|nr:hypothetical protein [Chthonomonadaceae bacterium]
MWIKVLRLLKLLLKCYFLVSGILMPFLGCGLILLFWRMHGHLPIGYAVPPGTQVYAVPNSTLQAGTLPIPKKALSAKELAYGEKQMEEMVRDRPEMGRCVHKGDPIWQFCARQFGGEASGVSIDWNNSLPDGANGDHQIPYGSQVGYIRVRSYDPGRKQDNTCEELWSYAVYELCNIRSNKQQEVIWYAALSGKINRQEYIKRSAVLEYQALPYTVWIYNTLWKPGMEAKGIETTPDLWGLDVPDTADEWLAQYTDPNGYPWDYGKQYDDAVMPILRQRSNDESRP